MNRKFSACVLTFIVIVGVPVYPDNVEGEYRMYLIDRDTGEIAEDQPSIVTLTIRKNDNGSYSVIQTSEPSRSYWEAMRAGQIRRAAAQGFQGIVEKLRSQKFEDIYDKSTETASDVKLVGTTLSFSLAALPDVDPSDETAISMYGKGPWLRKFEVVVKNGEILGSSTTNILPKLSTKVYGKVIDMTLLHAENSVTATEDNLSGNGAESSTSHAADIEGKYRIFSVDRTTGMSDNIGYSITFTITKRRDGSYSLVENIARDQEYWEANIKKEIQRLEQEVDLVTKNIPSHPKEHIDHLRKEYQEMINRVKSRNFEDESSTEEIAKRFQVDGTKISFFFSNKKIPSEVTDLWGERAFGWTYEGVIQRGEIVGTWSTGERASKNEQGTFKGEQLSEPFADVEELNSSDPSAKNQFVPDVIK